jgi:ParB family transcriptional regulator, chromosome partitioning protein
VRKGGLGRGLGALIPSDAEGFIEGVALAEIPVGAIEVNPYQPRRVFDEDALVALSDSIREIGLLQPILVRPLDEDTFQLIAGERRWRAAKRAGLDTVPAIVRTTTDIASLEQALVENLHRADLNALDEAAAFNQLIDDFGMTHETLALRVGRSRAAVTNTLRLLQLPPAIQHLLRSGRISAGHARALAGSPDRSFQERLARRIVDEGLSVRSVEEAVRARQGSLSEDTASGASGTSSGRPATAAKPRPAGLLELEDLLSTHLDTRVKVEMGAKRGKVIVEFATLEDLERIYRKVTESPTEA